MLLLFMIRTILIVLILIQYTYSKNLITNKLIFDIDKKYGKYAKNRFLNINKKVLDKLKNESPLKQLTIVNRLYNNIKYQSDKRNYNVNDYWATLYEFVGRGKGDCEDYTIAKYYTLKELGFDIKRLKFTYVVYKDKRGRKISHMILAYLKVERPRTTKDILVLDNIINKILPANKRKDIVKVIKMINGDTGAKSKKWKKLDKNMKRKKI